MRTTSSRSSRIDLRIVLIPPAAPTVIMISAPVTGTPDSSASASATLARTSGKPAFGMYPCVLGDSSATRRASSALNSEGGSRSGLPNDRSNTFSGP